MAEAGSIRKEFDESAEDVRFLLPRAEVLADDADANEDGGLENPTAEVRSLPRCSVDAAKTKRRIH
jgi:hypothetical protein